VTVLTVKILFQRSRDSFFMRKKSRDYFQSSNLISKSHVTILNVNILFPTSRDSF